MRITHLLVDYGGVLATQLPSAITALAKMSALPEPEFQRRYWLHRDAYDLGQSSEDDWNEVVGHALSPDQLGMLVAADGESWMQVNSDALDILLNHVGADRQLALVSNAPHTLAGALEETEWISLFTHRFYSCRLEVVKPDARVFEHVLSRIGATPERTMFIDDRLENTLAAAELGIHTITYHSSADLVFSEKWNATS